MISDCPSRRARTAARIGTALLLGYATAAQSINGYFLTGYSPNAVGLAGAGVAFPQDRLGASVNPASLGWVEPGYDLSIRTMKGVREAELDCRGIGACDRVVEDRSDREGFVIPNLAYSRRVGTRWTAGIAAYANGGINTSYGRALFDETARRVLEDPTVTTAGKLGADLSQLLIAPTVAWRLSDSQVVGISPIIGVQRFSVRGLGSFARLSAEPSSVSNRGTEYHLGAGVRVGWLGEVRPGLQVGAQYTSKVWMGEFDEYEGLLARGRFDIPAHWTVGLAWSPKPALTLVFDYQHIFYAGVDAVGNPGPTAAEFAGGIAPERRLGGRAGIGFGWRNQSVFKLGAHYRLSDALAVRAGWNHGDSQISNSQMLLNSLAPATINDTAAIGASWAPTPGTEVSVSYAHSFKHVNRAARTALFGTPVRSWLYVDAIDVSFSRRY